MDARAGPVPPCPPPGGPSPDFSWPPPSSWGLHPPPAPLPEVPALLLAGPCLPPWSAAFLGTPLLLGPAFPCPPPGDLLLEVLPSSLRLDTYLEPKVCAP